MNKQDDERKSDATKNYLRSALVSMSAGCMTLVVAAAAIFVGLLIDARLGTAPKWALILLIGSAPFTLGGVYLIVKRAMKRSREERERIEGEVSEEELKTE